MDVVRAVAVGELEGHQVIVSGSSDTTVRVWDLKTREQLFIRKLNAPVIHACIYGPLLVIGTKSTLNVFEPDFVAPGGMRSGHQCHGSTARSPANNG